MCLRLSWVETSEEANIFYSHFPVCTDRRYRRSETSRTPSSHLLSRKRMLYTELLRLWDESVQAVDAKDWQRALDKLKEISDPTSRTLFNTASVYLALGQLELALKALDLTIAKDERLAVAFFQRGSVMMEIGRLEEALSDYIWAQKHIRENVVIDYKQLGLRFKLYSWQVLYNAAAVYCRMGQWEQARDVLLSATQERGPGRGINIEEALESIRRKQSLVPLLVPEGVVFRPRKQDIEQLQQRDFLGKAKVISSMIPNDDFGGFEPLRQQKPGFYEPNVDGAQDSRYMRVRVPYMAQGPGQLTVPGGTMVFLFGEENRNEMATVIYDGQRGLLPASLLEPADVKTSKGKKENRVPSGIPLPPELKPPTRPQFQHSPAARPQGHIASDTPPPSYITATHIPMQDSESSKYTANTARDQHAGSAQGAEADSVVVKVHYIYTVALSVPPDTPYSELKEQIAEKLGQPASQLRLRRKQHGSCILTPLDGEVELGHTVQDMAEASRATLWCQKEDPLANRTILYQMVALYDYTAQGPEDLEFSEGDTIDILGEVNQEWLEGHCAGNIGIFPSCFAYREKDNIAQSAEV
ncbi:NADPH oxidase activator 1-like [Archocentrus centrarchus]|uniref:NADPH oxidase activator 1-like n=1 Tax=Archocentrus centrarchus TaxID=63155 RepID=UPI0011E9EBAC|nr:NADPH oxidase activator 1-like [Archocentrus centrarchus]